MDTKIGDSTAVAAELLRQGQLVAIPTETVYGLAGNALDPAAVARIFEAKNRPTFDPLIVHIADVGEVLRYATGFPAVAKALADRFWPGPLTLLLPRSPLIPDLVTSGLERVALRSPAHPLTQKLLRAIDFPLAAPSANPFGYVSPTTAQHVFDQLKGYVPYIIDGGPCRVGLESTIVGFEGGLTIVYRLGGISVEEITEIAGPVEVRTTKSSNPAAPGMLHSHYAPGKPLYFGKMDELLHRHAGRRIGILLFAADNRVQADLVVALSDTGDLKEAAQNLFAALRKLDNADVDIILAEQAPDLGIGRAINDRLSRAAEK